MVECKNIFKSFGDKLVLDDITCSFEAGKTNLIIGQSGSGKTVLMKCLVGLHNVDSGDVFYDGRDFTTMNIAEKRVLRHEIGMLFQGGALFDSLNVNDNVMFPLNMLTDKGLEEKQERVDFCLKRVNLENAHNLMPSELSGGMTKRVAIARAIVLNPNYLFCDEPNSGLDPKTAGLIDELIKEITVEYNITTIINTHDMNSIFNIGDSISFIYKGKLWWKGTKDEILSTDNPEFNDFVFSMELIKRLKKK